MKKIVRIGAIALIAFAAIGVMSCDFVSFIIASVSGSAVNALAEGDAVEFYKGEGTATLVGATITLTNQSTTGAHASGTVASDGTFTLYNVEPGRYILSGRHTGWTFVPRLVDITGFMTTLPTVIAYPDVGEEEILLLVEWENMDYDVDSYMVRDDDASFTDSTDATPGTKVAGYKTSNPYGYEVDPANKVVLERDVKVADPDSIPRVETIRVYGPVATGTTEYLRYYLRLFNQSSAYLTGLDSIEAAGATVFVMQGGTHLGTFPIAYNTAEQVVGVVAMKWTGGGTDWLVGSFGGTWLTGDGLTTGGIRSISNAPVVVDEIR